MTARDHLATARRQLDGADRSLATGLPRDVRDADSCLAGMIAEASKARLQIAYDRGRDDERADAAAQAQLDGHVRVMRGRDAIALVLQSWGWDDATATERANNIATGLSGAGPLSDVVADVAASIKVRLPAHVACLDDRDRARVLLGAITTVVTAWVRTERAPEAPEPASPDELADADVDAEGPCRAGDESRCPEHLESSPDAPDTTPPPAPVSPTEADLVRLGALCTRDSARAGDAA